MAYSLPSLFMRVWILVASEEATAGSVIRNAERIFPSRIGSHHVFTCSGVPYLRSVSMLPVSGAEQLNTSGAHSTRPMISQSGAYSRLVSVPPCDFGRHRFHNPAARAFGFSSSMIGTTSQRLLERVCACQLASFG